MLLLESVVNSTAEYVLFSEIHNPSLLVNDAEIRRDESGICPTGTRIPHVVNLARASRGATPQQFGFESFVPLERLELWVSSLLQFFSRRSDLCRSVPLFFFLSKFRSFSYFI